MKEAVAKFIATAMAETPGLKIEAVSPAFCTERIAHEKASGVNAASWGQFLKSLEGKRVVNVRFEDVDAARPELAAFKLTLEP